MINCCLSGRNGESNRQSCGECRRIHDSGYQRHQESFGVPVQGTKKEDYDDAVCHYCWWPWHLYGRKILESLLKSDEKSRTEKAFRKIKLYRVTNE